MLTGSTVYVEGMKYLKLRMPISQCKETDIASMKNNKFVVTFGS